jgi:stage V sporulation protein S
MPDMIKVSAQSLTTAVAGAIAGVVRDHGRADVQAIGASAVNQAVKAIAIAHGYLEDDRLDIYCLPAFVEVQIGGQERTAIRFAVEVLAEEGEDDEYDEDWEEDDEEESAGDSAEVEGEDQ